MEKAVQVRNQDKELDFSQIEKILIKGDLASLNDEQQILYYQKVCESVGLNPLTRPFDFNTFNGKKILYANKNCAEQLRQIYNVSIIEMQEKIVDDVYVISVKAISGNGRTDMSTGSVVVGHLKGEAKANAMMKAETKAKRRVTLSICGLGMLDESEVKDLPKEPKFVPAEANDQNSRNSRESSESSLAKTIDKSRLSELKVICDDLGWDSTSLAEFIGKPINQILESEFPGIMKTLADKKIQALNTATLQPWQKYKDPEFSKKLLADPQLVK